MPIIRRVIWQGWPAAVNLLQTNKTRGIFEARANLVIMPGAIPATCTRTEERRSVCDWGTRI